MNQEPENIEEATGDWARRDLTGCFLELLREYPRLPADAVRAAVQTSARTVRRTDGPVTLCKIARERLSELR